MLELILRQAKREMTAQLGAHDGGTLLQTALGFQGKNPMAG
jgi:hypothetical protein